MKLQDYNPFITIRELFGIFLPGAMVTICLMWLFGSAKNDLIDVLTIDDKANSFLLGLVFLLVAYFFGHLIFQLGSFVDDFLYDPLKDYFFKQTRLSLVEERRGELYSTEYMDKLNNFEWSLNRLREYDYKGYYNEVEAIVADAKFFRAIFVFSLFATIISISFFKFWVSIGLFTVLSIVFIFFLIHIYPFRKIEKSDQKQKDYKHLWKKYGRWLVVLFILFVLSVIAHIIFIYRSTETFDKNYLVPIFLISLIIISLYFYFTLRQKSCKKLYTHILFIDRKLHAEKKQNHESKK